MRSRRLFRAGRAPVAAMLSWGLLLFAGGCATFPAGYTAISVAAFEAMPDSLRERGMMVRLKPGAHIVMDAAGARFLVVDAATDSTAARKGAGAAWDAPVGSGRGALAVGGPLVACTPSFGMLGGGSYTVPGLGMAGGQTITMPSTPAAMHEPSSILDCDTLSDRGNHLVCRCEQTRAQQLGRDYFCRNPGYEQLLRTADPRLHPGYSIIDGAFEVSIPKDLIHSLAAPRARPDSATTSAPAPVPPAHTAFQWPYDIASMDALDEAAALSGLPLDDGELDLKLLAERCASANVAASLGLCLAAEGRDDLAFKALENGLKKARESTLWTRHDEEQDACFVLMLLSVAEGKIDKAADAAGVLLHLERPDWFFPESPVLFVPSAPHSLLARFLARIETPLRANWPAFIAELEARLGAAPAPAAAAAGMAPANAEEAAGRLERLMQEARRLGLFHRAAKADEIAACLGEALAARPEDADLLRFAVEFELSRFGPADRLARAMSSAEALLRVDAAQGHRARAQVREAMGDLEGADADLASAAGPGIERGEFLVRNGRYDEAFAFYDGLVETSAAEQDPDYRFARAAVLARSRVAEGIQRMERHLARTDGADTEHLAWAHLRLGRLLALAGRKKEAGAEFAEAGRLDPLLWQAGAYAEAVKRVGFGEDVVR